MDTSTQKQFVPLTESQRGIFIECLENPSSDRYNIPFAIRLPHSIDLDRLEEAVRKAALVHPALFVTVCMKDDVPVMQRHECSVEICRTSAGSADEYISSFIKPFDLEKGPLYRFGICSAQDADVFALDVHHIVFDGMSLRLFLQQVCDAYDGIAPCAEEVSLFDICQKELDVKQTEQYRESQKFFEEKFHEVEFENDLLSDVTKSQRLQLENNDAGFYEAGFEEVSASQINEVHFAQIEAFAKENEVSESTVFMSAFAYTLSLFVGTKQSCFTTVHGGRYKKNLGSTVGMFVKTVPLCIPIDNDEHTADFLKSVQNNLYSSMKHEEVNFGELVKEYGVNSDISFIYQGNLLSEIELGGNKILPEFLVLRDYPSKILCMVIKTVDDYKLRFYYSREFYSAQLIESFAQTMIMTAAGFLNSETPGKIEVVSKKINDFYNRINSTEKPFDKSLTVNRLLDEAIKKYPQNDALVYNDKKYTFSQFDLITKRIASYIKGQGLGKEDFAAVLAPRCDKMILSAWGIIRSGAAFLPLDPSYPAERLNFMIKDSSAGLLIADRSLVGLVNEYKGKILFTDEIDSLPEEYYSTDVEPHNAISIIYTSGTTGTPKGCVLENCNLTAFSLSHKDVMCIDENSRAASYASFGFDAGLMDLISVPLCGAALYIIPDEIRLDLIKVEEFFCKNKITHSFMTTQVGRMFAEQTNCSSLKAFMVGGEKLVPFTPKPQFKFINGYGPCETMAYICHYDVRDNGVLQPVGKPSANTKLYVTDSSGRLLPPGAIGELGVAGLQVSRGYLGLPDKTALYFISNKFSSDADYSVLYKTGDVVRLLPDGNIDFVGRRDGQVKIRGFRVELTEVEEIVRRYSGITDATVTAYDDSNGGKYLAAYVVSKSRISKSDLKTFIRSEKPAYMVPQYIIQLEQIPYTQNQKINKRALPKPDDADSADKGPLELPSSQTEQTVYDIAYSILGTKNFGVNTNLFDAGMTSIGTVKFNLELAKAFNRPVKISDVKENGTVKMLASFLEQKSVVSENQLRESYPLMQNQAGIFVEMQMEKDSLKYNIPVLFKISQNVDVNKLQEAVSAAVNAHPYIKTVLKTDKAGSVAAFRNDESVPHVEIIDVDVIPENSELVKPFALTDSSLYRIIIYRTKKGNYLFMDFHHIICDGTSLAVLINDINKAYAGEIIAPETFTGFDASVNEELERKSKSYEKSASYFEKLLSGCNTECLPAKCAESDKADAANITLQFSHSSQIIDFCRQKNISLNAFFNASFSYTLLKFIHSEDAAYCTVYNGRNDTRLAECFAMLVKTLPVRAIIEKNISVLQYIESMQKQLFDSMSNDCVSFAELSSRYGLQSDIFFNYQGDSFTFDTIGGEKADVQTIDVPSAKAPFSVELYLENDAFVAKTTYRKDYLCREFAESFVNAFDSVSAEFLRKEKLETVTLASDSTAGFYAKINSTAKEFENIPSHAFIERIASCDGERIAVKTKTASLTYRELNEKANVIAHRLIELNVKPDDIVSIILERSEYVPVAELGVLKAGGAFLNMLPSYPDDRIDFSLQDASSKIVIASNEIIESRKELFSTEKPYKAYPLEELLLPQENYTKNPTVLIKPENLAYTIYTSGSTGKPKGVMIEHHNLSNFIQTSGLCELEEKGSTIFCMSSISFDMSITEMLFSLSHGTTIYIAGEEEIHNLDFMNKAFVENKVDIMMMTPSLAWSLLSVKEFEPAIANLKGIVLGAEAFQPDLYAKLKSLNPDMIVMNGYGPTECTQVCSAKTLNSAENITIGKPFANTQFYVTDEKLNVLPMYATGELIICGEGVCRGYINLPLKNNEAFVEMNGVRGYRSGDIVRFNRDGEVEFAGRKDNQVKLRGFRIELDEIENVIQSYDGILQSKVVVRNNGKEDYLAAFFTAATKIEVEQLTQFIKTKLTYYMVPQIMMQLEKMPVTQNGKIDKKALPQIEFVKKERTRKAPKKSLEEKIVELFKSILETDECYADDNFFEIGGTSLSASKAVMKLKSEGYKIEYQDIFDHQNAEELAAYLEGTSSAAKESNCLQKQENNSAVEPNRLCSTDSSIRELIKFNTREYADKVERNPLGNVLLTGASGFLGIHILKTLIEKENGKIICLLRKGGQKDIETKLKASFVYYFEDDFAEVIKERIQLIEGDITQENLTEKLSDVKIDTIINCAASVKHYANDDSIEFVNVHGVENLIELAKEKNARLVQISTTSVPGAHTEETYRNNVTMKEDELFVIDDMNNQYCRSKHKAELKVLEAVRNGMRGKIIRVGNLMGRHSDGEFQTNMHTNAFLNGMRGFVNMGKFPVSHSTDPMSFSPVDCTAAAVVLLAGTNDMFTVFHAESRSTFDELKIFESLNRCGLTVKGVKDEEYYSDFNRMMADSGKNEKVSALLTNDRPDMHMVRCDNRFTADILYRLGFSWPFIDDGYLDKVITSLNELDFFNLG